MRKHLSKKAAITAAIKALDIARLLSCPVAPRPWSGALVSVPASQESW